jgi:hypothetical protein
VGVQRQNRLLSFVTQHRNTYTVGPLDYCGTAKLVHGSGKDVYVLFPKSHSVFLGWQSVTMTRRYPSFTSSVAPLKRRR